MNNWSIAKATRVAKAIKTINFFLIPLRIEVVLELDGNFSLSRI